VRPLHDGVGHQASVALALPATEHPRLTSDSVGPTSPATVAAKPVGKVNAFQVGRTSRVIREETGGKAMENSSAVPSS
jgi:hypothetical protein